MVYQVLFLSILSSWNGILVNELLLFRENVTFFCTSDSVLQHLMSNNLLRMVVNDALQGIIL